MIVVYVMHVMKVHQESPGFNTHAAEYLKAVAFQDRKFISVRVNS